MKYLFIISFLLLQILITSKIFAQISSGNVILVIPHSSLHVMYADINEMRTDKIITRAVEVKIEPDLPIIDLYASIVSDNYSNGNFPVHIGLRLNGQVASGITAANASEILLTAIPIKILSVAKLANDEKYSLFFDVIQHGCDHFVTPGDYKFSIIFSQTPQ